MKLNNEQRKLVEDNHNLIYQYLIDNNLPQDEYYDIAAIGLCKAAIGYDVSKGVTFGTYVYQSIRNNIKQCELNDKRHNVETMSCNNLSTVHGEGTEVEHLETFHSNNNTEEENVVKAHFRWFIEDMSLRELQIMYYKTKKMNNKDIGKKFGVTHEAIGRVWRRIKKAYNDNKTLHTIKYLDEIQELEREMLKKKLLDIVELVV